MPIVRFGRFVPTSLREWDRLFVPLNDVITEEADGTVIVEADEVNAPNLPPQDAGYLVAEPNDRLTGARVLSGTPGEVLVIDEADAVTVSLPDTGTAGSYAKVTVDAKGRVTAGGTLEDADIPESIARVDEVADEAFGDRWTDLVVGAVAINPLGAANPPTLNNNTGCLEFSASSDNVIIITWQLPHGWSGEYDPDKAVVVPHLHVRHLTSTTAPNNVSRWKCEFDVADPFGNFTNAYGTFTAMPTVSVTNPANTSLCGLIDLGDLGLAGYGASCILHCRISRLAASDSLDRDTSVIALYSADLHYMQRTAGSVTEIPS